MKFYITILLFLMSIGVRSQSVGINTTSPHPSSALDISYLNKGVLIPQYDLTVLNDATNPILSPTDGLLIFNTKASGGNQNPKGYYVWIKDRWQRILISGTEPQVMALQILSPSATPTVLIPTNSTNNVLTNLTVASNKITGATLGADNSTINLPPGKYMVKYAVDVKTQQDTTGFYFSNAYHAYAVKTYLVDSASTVLTNVNSETKLAKASNASGGFSSFAGEFILDLSTKSANTPIRQKFEFDTGNTFTTAPLYIRANFILYIVRMSR